MFESQKKDGKGMVINMQYIPKVNEVYRHFKGNLYRIIAVAEHSETGEELVIYQAMYGEGKIYARPLAMFTEKVDRAKYPDAVQEYRFELQNEENTENEAQLDPAVIEFLDASTYEARLNILMSLRHRITDEMLVTMAIGADMELVEGSLEERFDSLKDCLLTRDKYEGSRLRS